MSVDIRAAAACLRERYGVSSIAVWGTCYGGGRALEVAAGYVPGDRIHDVDGSVGPPSVDPMAVVAWYPTRYNASALFGLDRSTDRKNMENEASKLAVMAVFAGKDDIPGATAEDASSLKRLLSEDSRVKDSLVKVFPDQSHGFAHLGLASKVDQQSDTAFQRFVDDEFGAEGRLLMDDGDADVACLLSTAFMETYSRVFLPTTGSPIAIEGQGWGSELEMKSLSDANTRDIRREIRESLESFEEDALGFREAFDLANEQQRKEVEDMLKAMQEGTDPGPYRIEDGDDLETMYSKVKATNVDFELF